MKVCSKCRIEKDVSEFGIRTSSPDGLQYYCKLCKNKNQRNYYIPRTLPKKSRKSKECTMCGKNREQYPNDFGKHTKGKCTHCYNKQRRNNLIHKMRVRLAVFISTTEFTKEKSTTEYLGCDSIFLGNYLQSTAISNGYVDFNIYDYNTNMYHIDHIIPVDAVRQGTHTMEEVFHYSNLQVLTKSENLSKSNSY